MLNDRDEFSLINTWEEIEWQRSTASRRPAMYIPKAANLRSSTYIEMGVYSDGLLQLINTAVRLLFHSLRASVPKKRNRKVNVQLGTDRLIAYKSIH